MDQQIKALKPGKSQKNQNSEFSTSCNSPEVSAKGQKNSACVNAEIRSRRYSLPLSKIINVSLDQREDLFRETFDENRLQFLNSAGFYRKHKKTGSDLKRKTFLIDEMNEKMMKKLKMKIAEHQIIFNGSKNVQRKYKPSRFAPLSDMKNQVIRPTVTLNRKSLENDLKLVLQSKFDKVKADFNMERLLTYTSKNRKNPISLDLDTPGCLHEFSPVLRKTVKFDC